jgi:hypothetical protein
MEATDEPAASAAQAAHAQLRTAWGRSEALANLAALPHLPPAPARDPVRWHALLTAAGVLPARIARGRPLRLLISALLAAAAPAAAAGRALWWLLTARADLPPPSGR